MDWTTVINFIKPELFVLIIFIWCLGLFLKKAPWFNSEWKIPFVLLFTAVLFSILYIAVVLGEGFTPPVIISAFIQGVIIAALSVFGNETIKQYFVKRPEDKWKETKWL